MESSGSRVEHYIITLTCLNIIINLTWQHAYDISGTCMWHAWDMHVTCWYMHVTCWQTCLVTCLMTYWYVSVVGEDDPELIDTCKKDGWSGEEENKDHQNQEREMVICEKAFHYNLSTSQHKNQKSNLHDEKNWHSLSLLLYAPILIMIHLIHQIMYGIDKFSL